MQWIKATDRQPEDWATPGLVVRRISDKRILHEDIGEYTSLGDVEWLDETEWLGGFPPEDDDQMSETVIRSVQFGHVVESHPVYTIRKEWYFLEGNKKLKEVKVIGWQPLPKPMKP